MKAHREDVALLGGDRVPVDRGEHGHVVAGLGDPRRADEDRAHRRAVHPREVEVGLEGADLAPEGVAFGADVHHAEVVAVEHDQPGARPEDRAVEGPQGAGEAFALDAERHRGRLAAGDDQAIEVLEIGRRAHLPGLGPERAQELRMGVEVALESKDSDYQPRPASSSPGSSLRDSSDCIAGPSPSDALATRAGSSKCVVASTIARARRSGSSLLKIPEPTKTDSAPSCITSDASAGVAIPPAQNSGTGSLPASATPRTRSSGACSSFAAPKSSISSIVPSLRMLPRIERRWRTASTMSPVPASPLERIIAAPSPMRRSASPRFVAPHTNGTLNAHLSMWCASSAGVSTSLSSM